MANKTKTKTMKKRKQTKGAKKSKATLKKKSGVKKTGSKRRGTSISHPRKVSAKRKKTTTPISTTVSLAEEESKPLVEENRASSIDNATTISGEIQPESELDTLKDMRDQETPSPSSSTIPQEDENLQTDSSMSETV
jgi:hypothetical protein